MLSCSDYLVAYCGTVCPVICTDIEHMQCIQSNVEIHIVVHCDVYTAQYKTTNMFVWLQSCKRLSSPAEISTAAGVCFAYSNTVCVKYVKVLAVSS